MGGPTVTMDQFLDEPDKYGSGSWCRPCPHLLALTPPHSTSQPGACGARGALPGVLGLWDDEVAWHSTRDKGREMARHACLVLRASVAPFSRPVWVNSPPVRLGSPVAAVVGVARADDGHIHSAALYLSHRLPLPVTLPVTPPPSTCHSTCHSASLYLSLYLSLRLPLHFSLWRFLGAALFCRHLTSLPCSLPLVRTAAAGLVNTVQTKDAD